MKHLIKKSDAEAVKMPFMRLIFSPFTIFLDNFKKFLIVSSVFSIILTMISLALQSTYLCSFKKEHDLQFSCADSTIASTIHLVFKIIVILLFISKWYKTVFEKEKLSFEAIITIDKTVIHLTLFTAIFFLLNATPLLSLFLLFIRVPNPNWKIEMLYFAVVSVGFLVPFVLMRLYSVLGFVLSNQKLPSMQEIWMKGRGNNMKILLAVFLVFIFSLFTLVNFYANFISSAGDIPFYANVGIEFIYNIFLFMILSIMVNHCIVQKQILFEE